MFSGDSVFKKVKVLSGGEKSRLSLARLMLRPANLLILDEPTNHLDMQAKDVLKQALINYQGSLLIVSHDREFLEGLTNKTVEFKNHKIREFLGDINYYLEKTNIEHLSELEVKKNTNDVDTNYTTSSKTQLSRENRKVVQRELNKAQKELSKVESELESLENEKLDLEAKFADPEIYSDNSILTAYQIRFKEVTTELDHKYSLWEKLSEEVEALSNEL